MANSARDFVFTHADFEKIRALIYRHAGISLSENKVQLVYSRLSRRLRALDLESFSDYLELLTPNSAEWENFTNALTTNLTAFFREQYHFPMLAEHLRTVSRRPLHLWSAATSTGEEPYSMAMTVVDLFGSFDAPVRILATDLDTNVLETARKGIYPLERIAKMPLDMKQRFFRKGKGERAGFAKVVPELQKMITFRQLNLLDNTWDIHEKFDAIFCRNVMIYFDKPTQRKLIEKFLQFMQPDALFFAGHSESFFHVGDLIAPVGRTVYKIGTRKRSAGGHDGAI